MLHSLLTNNPGEQFRIHFLCDSETPSYALGSLAGLVISLGAEWSPTLIDRDQIEQLPFSSWYGGYTASYRLLLPDLLPTVGRVLYLDADIVVLDSIRELWDIDLNGCCVAATTNPLYRYSEWRVKARLGLPDRRAYFNSGVLVFDLDTMRAEGLNRALVEWAIDHRDAISWPDQDILNAVLWRRRLSLHPRWNAFGGLWRLPDRDLPWTAEQLSEARRNPAIAHFIGPFKPWHYRCTHPCRTAYYAHLAQTGLPDKPIVGRTAWNWLLRPLPPLAEWTIGNGPAEFRAEIEHRVLSTTAGVEARALYRRLRGHRPDPVTRLLEALDATVADVVFVQLGSDRGEDADPLRPFILSGRWRGVVVEPVPYLYHAYRDLYWHRPGIVPVNAVIACGDRAQVFLGNDPERSNEGPDRSDIVGLDSYGKVPKPARRTSGLDERVAAGDTPTVTFETLCKDQGIDEIDVIRVRAGQCDPAVIEAFGLHQRRPMLLMFEYGVLSGNNAMALKRLLDDAGYDSVHLATTLLGISRDAIRGGSSHLARAWRAARRRAAAAHV